MLLLVIARIAVQMSQVLDGPAAYLLAVKPSTTLFAR
jgi:hypothetical protein